MTKHPLPPLAIALALAWFNLATTQAGLAQPQPQADTSTNIVARSSSTNVTGGEAISKIRDEGLNRSEVMTTLSYLTEVIGPRLTGSPNLKRANEWTKERLSCWGLANAHLEAWGPFGQGWSLKRFSAQLAEPQAIPLIAYPNAWSPGLDQPLLANVIFFDATNNADLERFKGKLKGAIVLSGQPRELSPRFEPFAVRLVETNLLELANAGEPRPSSTRFGAGAGATRLAGGASSRSPSASSADSENAVGGNSARAGATREGRRPGTPGRGRFGPRFLSFLAAEGAAVVVNESSLGDGGTVFVAAASTPTADGRPTTGATNVPRVWSTNAPTIPPQITMAAEDYNRLVRMIKQSEKLMLRMEFAVQFHPDDLMAYNTVAEITGSDLKEEVVMLGAHMDSWHAGTGATDNGAGVAATMEAVRILQALKLHPRRTIRLGLWSGEEQGLLGSRAYVARHFGYYTNATASNSAIKAPKDAAEIQPTANRSSSSASPERRLVKLRGYEKLAAYFNLDNGAGKIRGIYLQGNEAVRPLFRRWLEPFRDLGAETITLGNTAGTDHQSFDAIGLPGFQFIQDPLDYRTRTHHSNMDVLDRIQPDDLKQAAVILAAFAYDAAMLDERLPRKPVE